MRLKNLDLIATVLFAAINVGWTLLPNRPSVLSLLFALPLVFLLPGYALSEALFKRLPAGSKPLILRPRLRVEQPFNGFDRFILSLGLSLAIDILTGFMLNLLPAGLQILPWASSLAILATAFALIAAYRRRGSGTNTQKTKQTFSAFRFTMQEGILLGLSILLAVSAIWYATIGLQQQPNQDFTQFWMTPSQQANNNCAVMIGVHSNEAASVTYRVVITDNGAQVAAWPSIVLVPGGEWDQSVAVTPQASKTMYIQARLYRTDKPAIVYREVHMTLNSLAENNKGQALACTT